MNRKIAHSSGILVSLLTLLVTPAKVFAEYCEVNGEQVPCDQFFQQFGWVFALFPIIVIALFAFWIWMLMDCAKRDFPQKTTWIIILSLTTCIGAILYFFMVKRAAPSK